MKHCEKCDVSVRGTTNHCPLCQGILRDDGQSVKSVFPVIPEDLRSRILLLRWMLFGTIVIAAACIIVNISIPDSGYWSVFMLGGLGSFWITLAIAVRKRNNIPKNIIWQVFIISALAVIWDYSIGWHGWAIEFVFPIICAAAMIAMAVLAQVMRLKIQDYLIYMFIDSLFGLIPLILVLIGSVDVIYPSLICIAVSILSLIALLLFEGEAMRAEISRRFHL